MIAGLDGYSENDSLTADGGGGQPDAGAGFTQGDGGGGGGDAESVGDGSNVQVLEAGDAQLVHDTGPASDAACVLVHNGQTCNGDAGNCCSGICDETNSCTGNNCVSNGKCKPNLGIVGGNPPYWVVQGDCCLGQYCVLNANSRVGFLENPSGTCGPCVAEGKTAPTGTIEDDFAGRTRTVVYKDGCCSHSVDGEGKCK